MSVSRVWGVLLVFFICGSSAHSMPKGVCSAKFEESARVKHGNSDGKLVNRALKAMRSLSVDLAWPQRLILNVFKNPILSSVLTRARETQNDHVHQMQILTRMEVLKWQRRLNTYVIVPGVGLAISAGSVGLLGLEGLTVPGILAVSGILFSSLRHAPAYRFQNLLERGSWRTFSPEAALESRDQSTRHLTVSIESGIMGSRERGNSWPIARTAGHLDGSAALEALRAGDVDTAVQILVERLLTVRAVDVGNFYVLSLTYDPSLQPSPQVALWLYSFRTSFWKPAVKEGLLTGKAGDTAFSIEAAPPHQISRSKFIVRVIRQYMAALYQNEGEKLTELLERIAEHNDETLQEERQNYRLHRQRISSILLRLIPAPRQDLYEALYPSLGKKTSESERPELFRAAETVQDQQEEH